MSCPDSCASRGISNWNTFELKHTGKLVERPECAFLNSAKTGFLRHNGHRSLHESQASMHCLQKLCPHAKVSILFMESIQIVHCTVVGFAGFFEDHTDVERVLVVEAIVCVLCCLTYTTLILKNHFYKIEFLYGNINDKII